MKASLIVAVANFFVVLVLAGEADNQPIGQPHWAVMLVRLWPAFRALAAVAFPLLTVILAVRDYRRGARAQAVLAGIAALGIVALCIGVFGPSMR